MAIFGPGSTTAAAQLGSTVTNYFEKVMLEWMRPNFRFYTYASKKPLPAGRGAAMVFNRKVALTYGYMLSQAVPISALRTVSTNQVSALIEQIGDAVGIGDLARLESSIDTDAYAMELVADQAANTIEQFILQALAADTVVTHFVKKAGGVTEGGRATVVSAASATRLALSDIRTAVTRLQKQNVPPYDAGGFIGVMHPYQVGDIMSDTTFSGWVSYTSPAEMRNFEIGKVMNCRIVPSTKVPIAPGSAYSGDSVSTATGSAIKAYGAVIFGQDAFAVSELGGGLQVQKVIGASKSDPTNMVDVWSWKTNIAAKVLNPSALVFYWSSQDEVFRPGGIGGGTVVSDLAASEITVLFPSATTYYPTFITSW